ncbi:hypothetical protein BB560_004695 [Smittium megazygosporum]|uniref:Uncharacterized protein n=1 Tax=Smittium megazygosporum TaxID=133381 RepID=A0A2T9Z8Q4_9FUNG|nr:hypothetical protein BB560_004695 [Smittium megazygosporum]
MNSLQSVNCLDKVVYASSFNSYSSALSLSKNEISHVILDVASLKLNGDTFDIELTRGSDKENVKKVNKDKIKNKEKIKMISAKMNELENKVFDKTSVIKTEKVQDFLRDYSFDGFCVTVDGKGEEIPQVGQAVKVLSAFKNSLNSIKTCLVVKGKLAGLKSLNFTEVDTSVDKLAIVIDDPSANSIYHRFIPISGPNQDWSIEKMAEDLDKQKFDKSKIAISFPIVHSSYRYYNNEICKPKGSSNGIKNLHDYDLKHSNSTYQWTERDVTDFEKDKTGFIKDEYLGSYFNCTSEEGPIPSELHVLDSMDTINKKVQKFKELGLGGLVLNGVDLTRKKYSFNKISKADGHCIPQN